LTSDRRSASAIRVDEISCVLSTVAPIGHQNSGGRVVLAKRRARASSCAT